MGSLKRAHYCVQTREKKHERNIPIAISHTWATVKLLNLGKEEEVKN